MRHLTFLAATGLIALAGPAFSQAALKWRAAGTAINAAYPAKAIKDNIDGKTAIDCKVRRDLTLGPCEVIGETSTGYGFADGAKRAASTMRILANQGVKAGDIVAVTAFFETDGVKYEIKPTLTKSARTALTNPSL